MEKVLVTGGAGFIGSHLCERLVAEGLRPVVLDSLTTGSLQNLEAVSSRIEFVEGDIRSLPLVTSLAQGCSAIFHLAAVANVTQSLEDPVFVNEVNAVGTLNVCQAARLAGARVIFSSSAATYGEQSSMPVAEEAVQRPISLYGTQKLMGEHLLRNYSDLFGVGSAALRYFNIYGPRQDPSSPYSGVISIFAKRLASGLPISVFGDGSQYRDFVYVSDVVEANWLAFRSGRPGFSAWNVGRGEAVSILELAQALGTILGIQPKIEHHPARAGDIRESVSDPSLIAADLGWRASVGLEQGLRLLLQASA